MKKLLSGLVVALVGLSSVGQAAMIDDAVSWLYTNGYTIFSNTRDYQPNNYMRRDEAAKFFVKVAEGLGKTDYVKSGSECTFSDLNDGHADLKDIVVKSCRMGIFQGHNGKFMPTDTLTNSQALAVLLRITSGYESETGVSYWADNYYVKAQSIGLLSKFPVLNTKEGVGTRGIVAQLVYISKGISDGSGEDIMEVTVSQTQAMKKAKSYLNYTAFSREGLIEQLEHEQFSYDDAVYGTDNSGADWFEQAMKKAKSYLDYTAFSRQGLIDQLEFEGFTEEQAEYGVNSVGL